MGQSARSFLIIFTLLVVPAAAEPTEQEQLVFELVELTGGEETFRQIVNTMIEQVYGATLPDENSIAGLNESQREVLDQARARIDRFRELLWERLDFEEYTKRVSVPVYTRYFSTEELRELIRFYRTPTGSKSIEVMPLVLADAMRETGEVLMPVLTSIYDTIAREEEAKQPWYRTIRDHGMLALALKRYYKEEGVYPVVGRYADLELHLVPLYLDELPSTDVWGYEYEYVVSDDQQDYRMISGGADGVIEWKSREFEQIARGYSPADVRLSSNPNDDLISQSGVMIQVPRDAAPLFGVELPEE